MIKTTAPLEGIAPDGSVHPVVSVQPRNSTFMPYAALIAGGKIVPFHPDGSAEEGWVIWEVEG